MKSNEIVFNWKNTTISTYIYIQDYIYIWDCCLGRAVTYYYIVKSVVYDDNLLLRYVHSLHIALKIKKLIRLRIQTFVFHLLFSISISYDRFSYCRTGRCMLFW